MGIILGFAILTIAISSSTAKIIDCYVCREFAKTFDSVESVCSTDVSAIMPVDSTKSSCYKVVETVVKPDPQTGRRTTYLLIERRYEDKYSCHMLKRLDQQTNDHHFHRNMRVMGEYRQIDCYECDTDRCNSADSLKIFLVLLLTVVLFNFLLN